MPERQRRDFIQPGATPQERPAPRDSGLKARLILRADESGFQPSRFVGLVSQGVALGWYGNGALPLGNGKAMASGATARVSTKGATSYQPGATPLELPIPRVSGLKARDNQDAKSAEVLGNIKALL